MNMTLNEKTMLQMIAQNEMNAANGQEPASAEETNLWTDCLDLGELLDGMEAIRAASFGGILASLSIKGLVLTGDGSRDSGVQLTDAGFLAWREMKDNWQI